MNAYILLMNIHETQHELPKAIEVMQKYLSEDIRTHLFISILADCTSELTSRKRLYSILKAIKIDQDYDDAYLML